MTLISPASLHYGSWLQDIYETLNLLPLLVGVVTRCCVHLTLHLCCLRFHC